jgi:ribosomal protein S18 acetylase RimI-like enzyme
MVKDEERPIGGPADSKVDEAPVLETDSTEVVHIISLAHTQAVSNDAPAPRAGATDRHRSAGGDQARRIRNVCWISLVLVDALVIGHSV